MKTFRGAFAGVGLFSGVSNILMLTGPFFMLEIYDRVLPSRSVPTLVLLAVFVAVLYAAQGVIEWIRGRVLARIGVGLDEALSRRVHQILVRLSLRRGSGEGMEPVRDVDAIRSFLSGLGPTALFDLPWIPLYIGIVFLFHWMLGVTALGGALLLVALTLVAENRTWDPMVKAARSADIRASQAAASRRNAEVLTAMGFGGRMAERWDSNNRDFVASQLAVSDIAGGFGNLTKVLRFMLQSAVLGIGAWLVIRQEVTAGVIIAASILTARALAPVDLAIAHWKSFVAARQGWSRLEKLLSALPEAGGRTELPAPATSLSVENMSVMTPTDSRLILHNVSFSLQAGQGLGVIGPSASGKSSLARALVGVWPAVRGDVRLDGAALEQWSDDARGRHVGYLPQDVELFDGTVAENIARFEANAPADAIIAAARTAGVHDLIVNLRDGYETRLGENGAALSAGQQQRIALARALYRDPFLVVLDEPNSNLDAEGEAALTDAIGAVRARNGIVVVIAHRPSALAATDTILVMRQGRVEKIAPKDEVMRTLVRVANAGALAAPGVTPKAERQGQSGEAR
ncbi:type I secretion system permease/ATPase [Bosea caraganae]|uniref:Type I secretion system permease/ATPase n=2 Tax=Bosea caraganae TaxID=2763117 RepID=A0A370LAK5_9HYPH|nr:type I secretion system permease/ATPase [Bosea caraganae]RDJ29017.1 type I secretion system permease/ATPase [Bosea caraganae]